MPRKREKPNQKSRMGRTKNAPDRVDKRSYGCKRVFKGHKATVSELERLADRLIKWVDSSPNALTLEQFYLDERVAQESMQIWRKRCIYLNEAAEYAKMRIGIRRELGVMNRSLESNKTSQSLHYYLSRWDEINKYHALLKALDKDTSKDDIIRKIFEEVLEEKGRDDVSSSNTKAVPAKDS